MEKKGIVVLNYKSSSLIEYLINDLNEFKGIILLVDNSEDKNEEINLKNIVSRNKKLQIEILFVKNEGYYKGNYEGVKFLLEKYKINNALIMNPDISVKNCGQIYKTLEQYVEKKDFFIAGPKIIAQNSKTMATPFFSYNIFLEIIFNLFFPLSKLIKGYSIRYFSKKSRKVFAVEGSFYLVDSEKYLSLKKYFQNIFLYGEEILFGTLAKNKNWGIYYDSTVEVIHNHPHGCSNKLMDNYYIKSLVEISKVRGDNSFVIKCLKITYFYKTFIKKIILLFKERNV